MCVWWYARLAMTTFPPGSVLHLSALINTHPYIEGPLFLSLAALTAFSWFLNGHPVRPQQPDDAKMSSDFVHLSPRRKRQTGRSTVQIRNCQEPASPPRFQQGKVPDLQILITYRHYLPSISFAKSSKRRGEWPRIVSVSFNCSGVAFRPRVWKSSYMMRNSYAIQAGIH